MKFKVGDKLTSKRQPALKVVIHSIERSQFYGTNYVLMLTDDYLHHRKGLTYSVQESVMPNEFQLTKPRQSHYPEWW